MDKSYSEAIREKYEAAYAAMKKAEGIYKYDIRRKASKAVIVESKIAWANAVYDMNKAWDAYIADSKARGEM